MQMKPTPQNLLSTACQILKSNVLPNVSTDKKYELLMAVNAISIVERHLNTGEEIRRKELESLREIFPSEQRYSSDEEELLVLNKGLVNFIRYNKFDENPMFKEKIYDHLITSVSLELSVSNPKFLKKMQAK